MSVIVDDLDVDMTEVEDVLCNKGEDHLGLLNHFVDLLITFLVLF